MEEIALALAALQLLEKLEPVIEQRFKAGEITAEQQQEVRSKYKAFRAKGPDAFKGPEWDKQPT